LDTLSAWTPEKLHCITGCQCLRIYNHIIVASLDGKLINNGKFPISLGLYTTISKTPRVKPIDRHQSWYLDTVHVDIAFRDCTLIGGFKYALIFVDCAKCYNWTFGLKSLQHEDILAAFMAFREVAGSLTQKFCCDCDEKMFGGAIWSFLHVNHSSIAASPAGCESSNGLVEPHWKIMVHMSRAYLTNKQMPCSHWYFAIKQAACMINMIPGKYKSKLVLPFMLAHGVCPDQRAWLPLFSICYFHHTKDSNTLRSKNQAQTLDGIIIGCLLMSTGILIYNPRNQKYYKPDSYQLDSYHLLSSVYSTIRYQGGLFVSLHCNETATISEPSPPGTRVAEVNKVTGHTRLATVMDIPLDPELSPHYMILFDDGTSLSVPVASMPDLIPKPIVNPTDTCTSFHHFSRWDPKQHSSGTATTTKKSSDNLLMCLSIQLQVTHYQEA
jgi:hypothetical protein